MALSHLVSRSLPQHPDKLQHGHQDGHQQAAHQHHEDAADVLHAQAWGDCWDGGWREGLGGRTGTKAKVKGTDGPLARWSSSFGHLPPSHHFLLRISRRLSSCILRMARSNSSRYTDPAGGQADKRSHVRATSPNMKYTPSHAQRVKTRTSNTHGCHR